MAEISREDAIKKIKCAGVPCNGFCEKCCLYNKTISLRDALKTVEEDMQKLEKIEQMINECRAYPDDMADCLIEIEQIVKGGE